jgi:hypothetical protein
MKQSDIAVHTDAYPHNCPACIRDPRPASDESLAAEHLADVKATRAGVKYPAGTKLITDE